MSHVHVKNVIAEYDTKGNMLAEVDGLVDNGERGTGEPIKAILIPPEAIATRMHAYGLKTREEAFEAILKEHAVRLHNLEIAEHGAKHPNYKRLGGLAKEVEVTYSNGVKSKIKDTLDTHKDRISKAYLAIISQETRR